MPRQMKPSELLKQRNELAKDKEELAEAERFARASSASPSRSGTWSAPRATLASAGVGCVASSTDAAASSKRSWR